MQAVSQFSGPVSGWSFE